MGCSGVTYPFVLMSSSTVFTVLLHAMSQSNTCNVYVLYSFISIKLLSVHSCSSQCMIFFLKKQCCAADFEVQVPPLGSRRCWELARRLHQGKMQVTLEHRHSPSAENPGGKWHGLTCAALKPSSSLSLGRRKQCRGRPTVKGKNGKWKRRLFMTAT